MVAARVGDTRCSAMQHQRRLVAALGPLEGDEIVHELRYVIGVAVDTPDGLMVVRTTPGLDVVARGAEISRLAAAARDRTANPDEPPAQTFTLSNIGAVAGRFGTPFVPHGITAISSIGRADPRPVVRNGEIVIGRELPVSLSYDQYAIGRAFVAALTEAFEAPADA